MVADESWLDPEALARVASLDDPVRRRLYEHVRDSAQPVGRDQAAVAVGISRTLAAYHLDRLVEAELLHPGYARPPGRRGPGAGRPAKIYSTAEQELAVTVPPRDYGLLARLLVCTVERDPTGSAREAVNDAAYETGQHLAVDPGGNLMTVLSACGYQPRTGQDGRIELCNCPFHALSQEHPDTVCGLNLRLIEGVLQGGGHAGTQAELTPAPNRCCVTIHNPQPLPSDT